ncbi:hypothetical protein NB706_002668 [Xanthomonas sacchari]|nr:hypothetical protein [Xanthomonas sacchari]
MNMEKPPYSSDCISASNGGKPMVRYTGSTASWLSSSQATPARTGNSQGITPAATIIRMLPSPERCR